MFLDMQLIFTSDIRKITLQITLFEKSYNLLYKYIFKESIAQGDDKNKNSDGISHVT